MFNFKITKEAKVGIIVSVVLALFYWGFNYLKGRDIFQKTKEYYAVYSNIGGLRESNVVTINGFQVGVVKKITFDILNPRNLEVCFAIDSKVRLPKGSIAQIENIDLLGTVGVGLILPDNKELLKDGDTLIAAFETSFEKQFAPLKDKVEKLIVSTDSVMTLIQYALDKGKMNKIHQSIDHLEVFTRALAENKSKIDNILTSIEKIASNEKLQKAVDNIYDVTDSLKSANIASTLASTNRFIVESENLVKKINRGEGTLGMLVTQDSLYRQLKQTNRDLDSLLVDINRNPKRYVHFSVFGKKK